jgi:hypothetical protein
MMADGKDGIVHCKRAYTEYTSGAGKKKTYLVVRTGDQEIEFPAYLYPHIGVGDVVRVFFHVVTDGARHSMVKIEAPPCEPYEKLPFCSSKGCTNEVYVDSDGEEYERCFDCRIAAQEFAVDLFMDR